MVTRAEWARFCERWRIPAVALKICCNPLRLCDCANSSASWDTSDGTECNEMNGRRSIVASFSHGFLNGDNKNPQRSICVRHNLIF
ncbi:hypothetical protein NPIL_252411 [Nephila pilipes]|uniref:Uncharacterized protein n=1 Tax=Nephila pilipes TaxID=299642 RepID=A0A8X6TQ11_NEPPI|nr:hypothetical protein NPIL_252411 [Nephila pilipes]